MDLKEMTLLLHPLSVAFNKYPGKETLELYHKCLKQFSAESIKMAITRIVESQKRYPTISEIREIIQGKVEQADNKKNYVFNPAGKWCGQYYWDVAVRVATKKITEQQAVEEVSQIWSLQMALEKKQGIHEKMEAERQKEKTSLRSDENGNY